MPQSLRDWAVQHAQNGFAVFPLAPGSKDTPVIPPSWVGEAPPKGRYFDVVPTRDPDSVRRMWTGPAGESLIFNVGICTNDLLVADLDVKGGKDGVAAWLAVVKELGLPEITLATLTPTGGQHRFYRLPGDDRARNTVGVLGEGVDTRGWHGYVVAPGSRVDAGEYTWLLPPDYTPMAVATEQAVRRVVAAESAAREPVAGLEPDSEAAIARATRWLIDDAPVARQGCGGDNQTYQIACRVRGFGVEQPTCLRLMADHWNLTKAIPPWDMGGLSQKVANAYSYAEDPIGVRDAVAQFERVELDELPAAEPKSFGLSFWWYDPTEKPAPKRWLIKGVAALGETAGWIGPPGSGKSAAVLDVFMHGAANRPWRGHPCKQRAAYVYFAFERALLTKRRIAAYAQQWGLTDVPVVVVSKMLNMLDPRTMPVVWDTIKAVSDRYGMPVGGVTFDTFPKGIAAGGGEENSARDVNMVAANLRKLHELVPLHVALIGHTGKDESRGARGSNANQGDWDVDFRIERHDDHVKKLRIEKANDQEEGDVTAFRLKQVKIGVGEDGEDIFTSIVSEASVAFEPQPTHGESEQMLQKLERYLSLMDAVEFTLDDMRAAWGCSESTVERKMKQLKDALEIARERRNGSKEKTLYRVKL